MLERAGVTLLGVQPTCGGARPRPRVRRISLAAALRFACNAAARDCPRLAGTTNVRGMAPSALTISGLEWEETMGSTDIDTPLSTKDSGAGDCPRLRQPVRSCGARGPPGV